MEIFIQGGIVFEQTNIGVFADFGQIFSPVQSLFHTMWVIRLVPALLRWSSLFSLSDWHM